MFQPTPRIIELAALIIAMHDFTDDKNFNRINYLICDVKSMQQRGAMNFAVLMTRNNHCAASVKLNTV
jgi:hypothetical protein